MLEEHIPTQVLTCDTNLKMQDCKQKKKFHNLNIYSVQVPYINAHLHIT